MVEKEKDSKMINPDEDLLNKSYLCYYNSSIKYKSNSKNHIESDLKDLSEKITNDSKEVFNKKPDEKYRRAPIGRHLVFPIENFIEFKVPKRSKNNQFLKMKTYMYLPEKEKFPIFKALVFLFHGMQSHGQNSAILAQKLVEVGCVVVTYDKRGHGYSEGANGNIEDFEYVLQDSRDFMSETIKYFNNEFFNKHSDFKKEDNDSFLNNLFIGGLSMGGLISFYLAHEAPKKFKGVLFFAPAIDIHQNSFMRLVIKFVNFFYSNYEIPRSKEPIAYKNPESFDTPDMVIYNTRIKAKTVRTLLYYAEKSHELFSTFSNPFIIVIPGIDKLVPSTKMFEFYEKSVSKDKEVLYYNNLWHAVYIEEEMYEIRNKIADWILKRIEN